MSPPSYEYDVYLSYNGKDFQSVKFVADRLRGAGVVVWFWDVVGGDNVSEKIRESLERSACSAIFVGAHGLGPLQSSEVLVNVLRREEQSGGTFKVIPVLLPGADLDNLIPYLRGKYWVDFRAGLEDEEAFGLLLKSIWSAARPTAERTDERDKGGEEEPAADDGGDSDVSGGHESAISLQSLISRLSNIYNNKMGDGEQLAVRIAGAISQKINRPADSTLFMAALLDTSSGNPSHSGFSFLNELRIQRAAGGGVEPAVPAVSLLGLTEYDLFELPPARADWSNTDVAEELGVFIRKGAELAKWTGSGDDKIRARHFIGAALDPSAEDDPPAILRQLKRLNYDINSLRAGFLNHIKLVYPSSFGAWETIIILEPKQPGDADKPPGDAPPPEPHTPEEPDAPEEVERESIRRSSVSDQPTEDDSLGFGPYVKAIAGFLADERTRPPLTLSIEGEWGSGKSSFMMQLRKELRVIMEEKRREAESAHAEELRAALQNAPSSPLLWFWRFHPLMTRWRVRRKARRYRCMTVEFNPWRHDKEDALWASFALEFINKLSKGMTPGERLLAHFKLLHRRFKWRDGWLVALRMTFIVLIVGSMLVALVSLLRAEGLSTLANAVGGEDKGASLFRVIQASGAAGYIAVMLFFLSKFREFVGNPFAYDIRRYVEAPDYEGRVSFIEQFHGDFQRIVKTYAGENKVYVFIDDLDRCDVPKAADLMQAINLMVSSDWPQQLVFVIGMDREKVAAGLAVKNEKLLPYLVPRRALADNALAQVSPDTAFGIEYGYNFIEKFIQLPFSVPQPAPRDVRALLKYIEPLVEPQGVGTAAKATDASRATDKETSTKTPAGEVAAAKPTAGEAGGGSGVGAEQKRVEGSTPARDTDAPLAGESKSDAVAGSKKEQAAAEILSETSPEGRPEVERREATENEEEHEGDDEEEQKEGLTIADIGDSDTVRNIVLMVATALDYNPRRIKQFVNLFRLKAHIAYETGLFRTRAGGLAPRLTLEQLGKFVAIGLRWPRLLAELDEERTLLSEMQKLATVAGHTSSSQCAHEWLSRPELKRLLEFGCVGKQDPINKKKPLRPRRYSLADLDVERLLQVSPRARRVAQVTPAAPPQGVLANAAPANVAPANSAPTNGAPTNGTQTGGTQKGGTQSGGTQTTTAGAASTSDRPEQESGIESTTETGTKSEDAR